jgi:hypothetical protein
MKSLRGARKARKKAAKPRADKLALALKGYKEAVEGNWGQSPISR